MAAIKIVLQTQEFVRVLYSKFLGNYRDLKTFLENNIEKNFNKKLYWIDNEGDRVEVSNEVSFNMFIDLSPDKMLLVDTGINCNNLAYRNKNKYCKKTIFSDANKTNNNKNNNMNNYNNNNNFCRHHIINNNNNNNGPPYRHIINNNNNFNGVPYNRINTGYNSNINNNNNNNNNGNCWGYRQHTSTGMVFTNNNNSSNYETDYSFLCINNNNNDPCCNKHIHEDDFICITSNNNNNNNNNNECSYNIITNNNNNNCSDFVEPSFINIETSNTKNFGSGNVTVEVAITADNPISNEDNEKREPDVYDLSKSDSIGVISIEDASDAGEYISLINDDDNNELFESSNPEHISISESSTKSNQDQMEWAVIEETNENRKSQSELNSSFGKNVTLPQENSRIERGTEIQNVQKNTNLDNIKYVNANILYHKKPHINNAIIAMLAMGYKNEGKWLTCLLESVDGNINEALNLLQPKK